MTSYWYKLQELIIVFVIYPISLAIPYPVSAKIGLGLFGFAYLFYVLFRVEKVKLTWKRQLPWKLFWKRTLLFFTVIAVVTTLYILWKSPENLFLVPKSNPTLFIIILFVYSFLSVWPQEIIYRTFFFQRYKVFFQKKSVFIFVNASLFCLAHLFFKNTLVLILTFIGGILFALSYMKYNSTTLVSIEHALYGNWLFTVGMGQMLGFPGMEN